MTAKYTQLVHMVISFICLGLGHMRQVEAYRPYMYSWGGGGGVASVPPPAVKRRADKTDKRQMGLLATCIVETMHACVLTSFILE
jgi:hypothetical protein